MRKSTLSFALALSAGALSLSACSKEEAKAEGELAGAIEPDGDSLPDALGSADGMSTVASALETTGIDGALEGNGSYTIFAPSDTAFGSLGDAGKQMVDAEDHAALAAFLRAHMLPGYVTPQDLASALDNSEAGEVKMPTVSGNTLTFTRKGEAISVTSADGSEANIAMDAVAGGSSIAIPIDGSLKKLS